MPVYSVPQLESQLIAVTDQLTAAENAYNVYVATGEGGKGWLWDPKRLAALGAARDALQNQLDGLNSMLVEAHAYQDAVASTVEAELISQGVAPAEAAAQAAVVAASSSPSAASYTDIFGATAPGSSNTTSLLMLAAIAVAGYIVVKQVMKK